MQNNFDKKGASERLEQLAIERAQFRRAGIQLAELTRPRNWTESYRVYQSNTSSKTWHIVHAKDNHELVDPKELEELVVSIQGIIWKHDLPPFTQQIQRPTQARIRFLRQSVTLTGFETATFNKGVQALLDVQGFFDRHIPVNKIEECTIIDKYDDSLGIQLSNRYFTARREAPTDKQVAFTLEIDPSGYLASLAGDQFFHGEQNIVKYYNRKVVDGGAIKYENIPPVRFRVGDIVEGKVTLMLVPVQQGRFKLIAVLRSLTLLDTSFAQTSAYTSNVRIKKLMQVPSQLKRSIMYEDEEEEMPPHKKATNTASVQSSSTSAAGTEQAKANEVVEEGDKEGEKEFTDPMAVDN